MEERRTLNKREQNRGMVLNEVEKRIIVEGAY
jgi:hypothetical protein